MSVRSLFDLTGKVAVVTGGSRGLGLAMAEALGEMGARVAITARRADELAAARVRLADTGVDTLTVASDLADPASIAPLVDTVVGRWGAIDILVNNAGTSWGAPAVEYPDAAWRKVMSLNIDAQFFLAREVARRAMIPRGAGKIVNIASIAGLAGNAPDWELYTAGYNASKGALVALTRALASEWGPHNINVNALCPGFFPSKMSNETIGRIEGAVRARTPLRRLGGDDDLKGAVVFLASEASRHITGQALVVDGGFLAV